jgi:hypothetical protein
MIRTKDDYNGSTTHFTHCYSGYQKYGITGPCSCLQILNPTPATVIPAIMRGVKPHNMPSKEHNPIECSGCFKNQYATITPNSKDYHATKMSCQCSKVENM